MADLSLNWGIVCTGSISQDFATSLYHLKSDKHVLKAVAARRQEDAAKFAQRFEIAKHYGSYDELFADPEINIVYIGSITSLHKDLSIRAMKAGKHVLCEKTMCLNGVEQEEMLATAKAENRFFMEAIWTRFFPLTQQLRTMIKQETIGKIKFFSGNFMMPVHQFEGLKTTGFREGSLSAIGIYPIQMACLVFEHEKPLKVSASGNLPSGPDEACTIVLTFPGNRIAQINISTNCADFSSYFIVGERGVITIPRFSWCPTEIIVSQHTANAAERKTEVLTDTLPADGGVYIYDNSVGLRFQAEGCRQAIAQGKIEHEFVTHDMSRLFMHIMDETNRQIKS